MTKSKRAKLSAAHHQIAQAMGVPQMSVESEQRLTRAAREGAGEGAGKPVAVFYECDICGHCHPWEFNGDCRDDANRFTCEQLDAKFGGPKGYWLRTMSERVEQDRWL